MKQRRCLKHTRKPYLRVPRIARGRAGCGHAGENVRRAEGSESLLARGVRVGSDVAAQRTLREQHQSRAEGLGVEEVSEGDGRQISAVANEAGILVVENGLHLGSTVLIQKRAIGRQAWSDEQWGTGKNYTTKKVKQPPVKREKGRRVFDDQTTELVRTRTSREVRTQTTKNDSVGEEAKPVSVAQACEPQDVAVRERLGIGRRSKL